MRILFSSTRGAGHLQPLLPYARVLRGRGHEIMVAAPVGVSETLREAGFVHAPFGHPGDDALKPIWSRLPGASETEAMAIAAREIFAGLNAQAALPKLLETMRAWRPDLVVRDSVEFGSVVAAEAAGVPHARVAVHSVSFEDVLRPLVDAPMDTLRRQAGLSSDDGAWLRDEPVFSAFPASLDQSRDSTLRTPFRSRVAEEPPSAPAAWDDEGDARPLVYLTFGTIAGSSPSIRSIYRTALDAIADLPVRALLTTGRGMEAGALGVVPANVHVEAWVPQRDVLPRVAALVCHGGSGTLLGGLAFGLPLVVAPFGADQPHNGRLVAAAGAGLTVPSADASTLRAAIERVLADPELRRGAQRFAVEIAALPTTDAAVDVLIELAN